MVVKSGEGAFPGLAGVTESGKGGAGRVLKAHLILAPSIRTDSYEMFVLQNPQVQGVTSSLSAAWQPCKPSQCSQSCLCCFVKQSTNK